MSPRVSPASSMAPQAGLEGEVERVAVDAPADLGLADAGDHGLALADVRRPLAASLHGAHDASTGSKNGSHTPS